MTESAPGGSKRWVGQRDRIADFIYQQNGATKREIMVHFGFSQATLSKAMKQLIEMGEATRGCEMDAGGKIDTRRILYLPS